jgi:para-aminobenzoate synthetase component 1
MERTPLGISAHPCQVFEALYHQPGAILLESQRPTFAERHSFVAWQPEKVFRGDVTDLDRDDFLSFISSYSRDYLVAGYIGYETCQWIEELPRPGEKDRPNPDIYLAAYPRFLVFDHVRKTWHSWYKDRPPALPTVCKNRKHRLPSRITGFNQSKAHYLRNVGRVLDYIKAGDVYQVNYTQRVYYTYRGDPLELYLRLRQIQPVAFGAFINLGDGCVISGSPELFLRKRHGKILSKPMKGTRGRSQRPSFDRRLREELRKSKKDRAENTMIVDLMRNDLGRFCVFGSVDVPKPYVVEAYDTVYQMVSYVSGMVDSNIPVSDILCSTFPPGSVTGAPKKRVMEIIYELEPHQRGVYCGAIGCFLGNNMVLNVAIRTLELFDGKGILGVGGGIVADSDPELEYEESILKAKASLMALGIDS